MKNNTAPKKSDAQILQAQKDRLEILKKQLVQLHFLTIEEIQDILTKMQFMPQAAHNEVLELLKAAQSKQNDFLKRQLEKNPAFLKELEQKVQKEYKKAIEQITAQESSFADTLIDQLYENI